MNSKNIPADIKRKSIKEAQKRSIRNNRNIGKGRKSRKFNRKVSSFDIFK